MGQGFGEGGERERSDNSLDLTRHRSRLLAGRSGRKTRRANPVMALARHTGRGCQRCSWGIEGSQEGSEDHGTWKFLGPEKRQRLGSLRRGGLFRRKCEATATTTTTTTTTTTAAAATPTTMTMTSLGWEDKRGARPAERCREAPSAVPSRWMPVPASTKLRKKVNVLGPLATFPTRPRRRQSIF
jgi:hypothetical protein